MNLARARAKVRRFLPFALASLATIAAVSLAIGPSPRGPYDRGVAVLTATLVAVIWYTCFTFLGVFGRKPTHLDLALEYAQPPGALRPIIRNLSDNRVRVRIQLSAYWDALLPVPFDDFYSGREEVPLEPHSGIGGWIEMGRPDAKVLLVKMQLEWWDDAGRSGTTEPRYWLVEIDKLRISAVIGAAHIARIFGDAEQRLKAGVQVDTVGDTTSGDDSATKR